MSIATGRRPDGSDISQPTDPEGVACYRQLILNHFMQQTLHTTPSGSAGFGDYQITIGSSTRGYKHVIPSESRDAPKPQEFNMT